MARMTLCLCSQLDLQRSCREQRQMLTLHFSVDSICTGSTSARLFCLPNMRIASHVFIFEDANQLRREAALQTHMAKICPAYCTHRRISIREWWVFAVAFRRIIPPDKLALMFYWLVSEIIVCEKDKAANSFTVNSSFLSKWLCFHPSRPNPDKS